MADNELPDDAAVEALLAKEHTGPLKPLEDAAAEEEATGKDEQQRLDDGDEDEPEDEPEPEEQPTIETPPAEEPEAEEEPEESGDAVMAKLDAVLKALGQKEAAKATETPAAEKPDEIAAPAHIQRLLDSEDPGIRDTGEAMLVEYRARETDRRERAAVEEQTRRENVVVALDARVEAVGAACNPPLTEKEKDDLVEYMTTDRNGRPLLASLSIDEGAQLRFPGRFKATNGKTDTAPKGAEGSRPVIDVKSQRPEKGTVDDRGGSAGPKPTHQKPPENETLEAAVERGYEQASRRARR